MSERQGQGPNYDPQTTEITDEQKTVFAETLKNLAPYEGQAIDELGVYQTIYERPDGYLSIYIPAGPDCGVVEDVYDNAVRAVVRIEEQTPDNHTIVTSKQYVLELETNEARYAEDVSVFDTRTDQQIANPMQSRALGGPDLAALREGYKLQQQAVNPIFSQERFREICEVLDELDPGSRVAFSRG